LARARCASWQEYSTGEHLCRPLQTPRPGAIQAAVELHGATIFKNEWNFWLYPAKVDASVPSDVLVATSWPEAEARLASGGKVLFLPQAADLDSTNPKLSTVPIFWTPDEPQRRVDARPLVRCEASGDGRLSNRGQLRLAVDRPGW
jgi:hypothetical protein